MSSSFELLSHPDRTLKEHLDSCFFIGSEVLKQKTFSELFASKSDVYLLFKQLVYFHDFGKATDYFQNKIIEATKKQNSTFAKKHEAYFSYFEKQKRGNVLAELEKDDRLSRHSLIGSYFQLARNKSEDVIEDLILYKIIKKHHQDLTNFHINSKGKDELHLDEDTIKFLENQINHLPFDLYQFVLPDNFEVEEKDWKGVKSNFSNVLYGSRIARKLKKKKSLRYFFFQHYLYSLLLSADKGDVKIRKGHQENIIQPTYIFPRNIVGDYKVEAFKDSKKKDIDKVREEAYQNIAKNVLEYGHQNFFSITLPTGMGKTFSAYNAAILLQNAAIGTPRIVYCLPFTSIIDQNVQVLTDIFEMTNQDITRISKNHHLSNLNTKFDEYEIDEQEGEYLTDGWEHDFIVTTFIQLMNGIFSNKNKLLRKFHNVTNSVIILDEVQNIPAKYYEAIEVVFQKMAEYFDTKFLFVTATQPLLMPSTEVIELTDPTEERLKTKAYFENNHRIVLDKSHFESGVNEDVEYWIDVFKKDIDQHSEKSFLFILNTVASSQQVFESLKSYKSENRDVYYLSSSILPCFRKEIIKRIQKKGKRKIVVSTQVVEAGVDIDLDIVYRDFAPLDSINQSAGRCNRNALKGKGTVKLFDTGKSKLIYDSTLRDITKFILKEYPNQIDESKLYELNLKYFEQVKRKIQDDNQVSQKLVHCMENLLLEDLAENFKLIEKNYPTYNVFILFDKEDAQHLKGYEFPTSKSPKQVWSEYLELMKIENRFERKQEIKKLRPELMLYVAKFPESKYTPPEGKKDNFIIRDNNWREHYDLENGFKQTPPQISGFY
ncbi:MAG: CRISPR-associated helicase Cas3' [Saprospiraceae bacterium]|jgi:CRISPR-associated endonuclease/helicase Cas3|nr:CRISPR-associated helicase Cas3' [Saprospiraceae bacterium]